MNDSISEIEVLNDPIVDVDSLTRGVATATQTDIRDFIAVEEAETTARINLSDDQRRGAKVALQSWLSALYDSTYLSANGEFDFAAFYDGLESELARTLATWAKINDSRTAIKALKVVQAELLKQGDEISIEGAKFIANSINRMRVGGRVLGTLNTNFAPLGYYDDAVRLGRATTERAVARVMLKYTGASSRVSSTVLAKIYPNLLKVLAIKSSKSALGVEQLLQLGRKMKSGRVWQKIGILNLLNRFLAGADLSTQLDNKEWWHVGAQSAAHASKLRLILSDYFTSLLHSSGGNRRDLQGLVRQYYGLLRSYRKGIQSLSPFAKASPIIGVLKGLEDRVYILHGRIEKNDYTVEGAMLELFTVSRGVESFFRATLSQPVKELEETLVSLAWTSAGSTAAGMMFVNVMGTAASVTTSISAQIAYERVWREYEKVVLTITGSNLRSDEHPSLRTVIDDYSLDASAQPEDAAFVVERILLNPSDALKGVFKNTYINSPGRVLYAAL